MKLFLILGALALLVILFTPVLRWTLQASGKPLTQVFLVVMRTLFGGLKLIWMNHLILARHLITPRTVIFPSVGDSRQEQDGN